MLWRVEGRNENSLMFYVLCASAIIPCLVTELVLLGAGKPVLAGINLLACGVVVYLAIRMRIVSRSENVSAETKAKIVSAAGYVYLLIYTYGLFLFLKFGGLLQYNYATRWTHR